MTSVSTSVCFAQFCPDAQVLSRLKCFTDSTNNYGPLSNEEDGEMSEMPQEGADGAGVPQSSVITPAGIDWSVPSSPKALTC